MPNKRKLFFILILGLSSCKSDPLSINVSDIEVEIKIERMEKDLFEAKTATMQDTHYELLKKYDLLYQLFFENMLQAGAVHDPMAHTYLSSFLENEDMQNLYSEIKTKFNDFSLYEKEFIEAFKHYKYYFPDSTLPKLTTFYSNFNANAIPLGNRLGIGLDMYLGKDSENIKLISTETLPQFIKDKMESKYLVSDGIKYWLFNQYFDESGDDFLSEIISAGKIMYLTDAMLPEKNDAIKMGYSEEELLWCKENQQNIWQIIVDEQLLYSKDQKKISQFTTNGPFTKGLPENSPARVGVWMGWEMVRDYVEENNISVLDLLAEKNYRKILKSYNPDE